jgi:hypothetical protein
MKLKVTEVLDKADEVLGRLPRRSRPVPEAGRQTCFLVRFWLTQLEYSYCAIGPSVGLGASGLQPNLYKVFVVEKAYSGAILATHLSYFHLSSYFPQLL